MGKDTAPVGSVASVRIILTAGPDPLRVILRQGKERSDGRTPFGLVGGKMNFGELSDAAAVREVKEETGLNLSSEPKYLGIFEMPGRLVDYEATKYRELGFDFPGKVDNDEHVVIANPHAFVFTASTGGPVPEKLIEQRIVEALDLRDEQQFRRIKSRHAVILRAWREFVVDGVPFPPHFQWKR